MKTLISSVAMLLCLLLASTGVSAQEMSFRGGVITDIDTIQVPATQQQQQPAKTSGIGRALGRTVKRALWRGAVRSSGTHAYDAYDVASGAVDDTAQAATQGNNANAQTVTAFVVMIRFDDGNQSAIQTASADGLQVGGRVRVLGSGSSARVVPE